MISVGIKAAKKNLRETSYIVSIVVATIELPHAPTMPSNWARTSGQVTRANLAYINCQAIVGHFVSSEKTVKAVSFRRWSHKTTAVH